MTTPDHPAALGTYQVVRLLADLPTGRTLLGTDTTGRAVVLTLVHPAVAAGAGFRERFTAQARAAAAAPLWFVAAVVDVDAAADPPWRAEVHVAGSTLQQFVDERGPLGDAGTAALAERLAAGLAAVHAGGSAHGDLTPSTIVLAEEGPRLVGFGLARAAGPGYGTPGYQAPEQAGAAVATAPAAAAADVFALGGVLVFAATGAPPVAGAAGTRPRGPGRARPVGGARLPPQGPGQRPTAGQVGGLLATPADAPTTRLRGGAPAGPRTPRTPPYAGRPRHARGPAGARREPPPPRPRGDGSSPSSPWRRSSSSAAVVAVVALTSRTGGGAPTAAGPSATLAPVAPPTAAPATGPLDPGTGATLVDLAPFGADGPRFTTPSRNISCRLTDTSPTGDGDARCDVAQSTLAAAAEARRLRGHLGRRRLGVRRREGPADLRERHRGRPRAASARLRPGRVLRRRRLRQPGDRRALRQPRHRARVPRGPRLLRPVLSREMHVSGVVASEAPLTCISPRQRRAASIFRKSQLVILSGTSRSQACRPSRTIVPPL